MSGNFAIKGGGVGPLMANAILNFHFDFLNPSLIIGAKKRKNELMVLFFDKQIQGTEETKVDR